MDTQAFDFLAEIPKLTLQLGDGDTPRVSHRSADYTGASRGAPIGWRGLRNLLANSSAGSGGLRTKPWICSAAFVGEEALLAFGFHAFGDHRELHAAAEGDDGAGDGGIVGIVGKAADERLVDLQDVQRQALEVAERGVAGAEVVDRQLYAETLEAVEDGEGLPRSGS